MLAQQNQKRSSSSACADGMGGVGPRPAVSQEENWQSRLRGLEECLCELLIENQRLRMSLTAAGVDPKADTAT